MAEDDPEPTPEPEPEDDEDEQAWQRLSPRLRGLIREELEEADKRRASTAPPPEEVKPKPDPAPAPKPEVQPSDSSRPRRTASDVWFGRRRS